MMAMTTSNSINVKPRLGTREFFITSLQLRDEKQPKLSEVVYTDPLESSSSFIFFFAGFNGLFV
jgi:hypothetical protein